MATIISIDNIDSLVRWRKIVIESVFGIKPDLDIIDRSRTYLVRHVTDKTFYFLVAFEGDKEVGCGGVCFYQEMPSPENLNGECAYLMNIYVRPPYRHQGIATEIVKKLVEKARLRQCGKIFLETTSNARTLYENAGFTSMPDLMKYNPAGKES